MALDSLVYRCQYLLSKVCQGAFWEKAERIAKTIAISPLSVLAERLEI